MNNEYLHEVEQVELRCDPCRPVSKLLTIFKSLGFTVHDDVVSLDRTGTTPPWQHSSVVEVEVQYHEQEVFGFEEGSWDTIRLKYMFAFLPYELTDSFIEIAFAISKNLLAPLTFRGVEIDADQLREQFAQIRADLAAQTGEDAGSEQLAILIQSTYPRSR